MKSFTDYLTLNIPSKMAFVNITPQVQDVIDKSGVAYAVASGAVTSGLGYVIWYAALPALRATQASVVQLSVPLLAALGGVAILGEPLDVRIGIASMAILGGIALVVVGGKRRS